MPFDLSNALLLNHPTDTRVAPLGPSHTFATLLHRTHQFFVSLASPVPPSPLTSTARTSCDRHLPTPASDGATSESALPTVVRALLLPPLSPESRRRRTPSPRRRSDAAGPPPSQHRSDHTYQHGGLPSGAARQPALAEPQRRAPDATGPGASNTASLASRRGCQTPRTTRRRALAKPGIVCVFADTTRNLDFQLQTTVVNIDDSAAAGPATRSSNKKVRPPHALTTRHCFLRRAPSSACWTLPSAPIHPAGGRECA
jgi:hypothetical protein